MITITFGHYYRLRYYNTSNAKRKVPPCLQLDTSTEGGGCHVAHKKVRLDDITFLSNAKGPLIKNRGIIFVRIFPEI